jgi:hypothetical protein
VNSDVSKEPAIIFKGEVGQEEFLLSHLFLEKEDIILLRNVGRISPNEAASHPRRAES